MIAAPPDTDLSGVIGSIWMGGYPGSANMASRNLREAWHRYKADVKAILSLRETIERATGARFAKSGSGFKTLCPFHNERTPSFFVQEERGRFKCFGAGCGVNGDVIQFLCDWHGIGFKDALEKAGSLAGLPPPDFAGITSPVTPNAAQSAWSTVLRANHGARAASPGIPQRMQTSASFLGFVPAQIAPPETGKLIHVQDPLLCRNLCIRPTLVHVYRSVDSQISCVILRQDKSDGEKFFLQVKWSENGELSKASPGNWILARFPHDVLRPLYGLEDLPSWIASGGSRILFVEGEKARDAAAKLLPAEHTGTLSLSTMGGGNAVKFSEMRPLFAALESRVISSNNLAIHVWPDADQPLIRPDGKLIDRQAGFAQDIVTSLHAGADEAGFDMQNIGIHRVVPPTGVAKGWDLADALAQGWTERLVLHHIKVSSLPVAGSSMKFEGSRTKPSASGNLGELDVTPGSELVAELKPVQW